MNIWNSDISTAPRDGNAVGRPTSERQPVTAGSEDGGVTAGETAPHTNTDAAISGHRLALLDGPQAANRSEDEALRGMASGGVQDECAIHPANHFILDDVGGGQ